jgi:porin
MPNPGNMRLPTGIGPAILLLLMLLFQSLGTGATESGSAEDSAANGQESADELAPLCSNLDSPFRNSKTAPDPNSPTMVVQEGRKCRLPGTMANYQPTRATEGRSEQSVEAELISNNQMKPSLIPLDFVHYAFSPIYDFKDRINDTIGLAFGIDYSALVQRANYTESGHNTAASQVLRVFGTWLQIGETDGNMGLLVWKTETRGAMGGLPTPRDMGFDTGSALSTANYKELDYWGITDLYWRQQFNGGKFGFVVGHMDPGDWADQYPLLNAWTSFTNDAFYNNPTEAIPKRGAGIAGQWLLAEREYLAAGIHDANGKDGKLDPSSIFRNGEFFSWVEYGFRSSSKVSARQNFHLHLWHQDRLESECKDLEESWGMAITQSVINSSDNVWFVRLGYSEGEAPQMRRFIGAGYSARILGRDTLGIATSWGSPPDKSLRSQVTSEVFYRLQITQNLTLTPSLQLTYKPSYTEEEDWIYIPGLRIRMVF